MGQSEQIQPNASTGPGANVGVAVSTGAAAGGLVLGAAKAGIVMAGAAAMVMLQ